MDVLAHDLPAELRSLHFVVIADGGEHAGDGDGLDTLLLHFREECLSGVRIQRSQFLAVIFKATANDRAAHSNLLDVLRPVNHRTDAGGSRCADAQDTDGGQMFSFHDSIGALGGAKHGLMNLRGIYSGDLQHCAHGA